MTEQRITFNQSADSWAHNWAEDRQPTRHPHERDLIAHAYTAADTFVEAVKNLVLPACPNIRVEICTGGNNGKDYVPLKDVTAATIGCNLIKHENSAARKIRDDNKVGADNIGDPIRMRLIIPSGLSREERRQSILALQSVSRFLKETSHNGSLLDGSTISSYKDEHLRPSDEGFRSFKAHLSVTAPKTFTVLDGVEAPSEIENFIKGNEGSRHDNPYRGDAVTGEIQIIHESMLDAEHITTSVRSLERHITERAQSNLLYRTFRRASDITSLLNAEPLLRAIRTNINNHYAGKSDLNSLVHPDFAGRTRVTPIEDSLYTFYSAKITDELLRMQPGARAVINSFLPATMAGSTGRSAAAGRNAVLH